MHFCRLAWTLLICFLAQYTVIKPLCRLLITGAKTHPLTPQFFFFYFIILINQALLIYISLDLYCCRMKHFFPWLCNLSTPLEPGYTLDPYCCRPRMLRGEDKLCWLTQRGGCAERAERKWEAGIQRERERGEIEGSAVVFVPSCGCAYATQVPARSTICSSQDTGTLSGSTNSNALSLSSLSVLQAFFTSQHDSMSKFTGCKPACEKKCEEKESGQEGWGDDCVGSGSSCINEMLCDQDVAGNDNDVFVFWCSKYMMLTSSFQGKDTGL